MQGMTFGTNPTPEKAASVLPITETKWRCRERVA